MAELFKIGDLRSRAARKGLFCIFRPFYFIDFAFSFHNLLLWRRFSVVLGVANHVRVFMLTDFAWVVGKQCASFAHMPR